jgi:hypothetical protein
MRPLFADAGGMAMARGRFGRGPPTRLPALARPADTVRVSSGAAIWLAVALVLPTAAGYSVVLGRRALRSVTERRRAAVVTAPPIERLGADLRRLHAQLDATENAPDLPGKHLRCAATRAAYLDALGAACRRLDIPPPAGRPVPRAEIYRAEAALRRAGLDVRARG